MVFAETKIAVTQSIRYGNGAFAQMDTPQISLEKAKKEGGKVFLRYDFEVVKADTFLPFQNSNNIIICIKFPSEYDLFNYEDLIKVTSLSGATDLMQDLLDSYSGTNYYTGIQNAIGRLPKAFVWRIDDNYDSKKDDFIGILLKMENKKGNKASFEFYIDLALLLDEYLDCLNDTEYRTKYKEFLEWTEKLFHEIPIDIAFYNYNYASCLDIANDEFLSEYGYDYLQFVIVKDFSAWQKSFSSSNRSFTLMVLK